MAFFKKLLKRPAVQIMLSHVLSGYIRLVYHTSRKRFIYHDQALPFMRGEQNGIFAFWHGRMLLLPTLCPPKRTMHVLISLHRDGLLISKAIGHFGQLTISGSTSRGGREAMLGMISVLDKGDNISITPDGPRGPRQKLSRGTVALARFSGKPILPVTFSSSRAIRFGSWDRFMLALPFGRIVFYVGMPIVVAADMDEATEEATRIKVEEAMNALVEQADSSHG